MIFIFNPMNDCFMYLDSYRSVPCTDDNRRIRTSLMNVGFLGIAFTEGVLFPKRFAEVLTKSNGCLHFCREALEYLDRSH